MVTPTTRLEISKHDSDNRFYECADAARADYIVTGNARHFHQTPQEHPDRERPRAPGTDGHRTVEAAFGDFIRI